MVNAHHGEYCLVITFSFVRTSFCGNAYGTYGETSYTECNMPCTPMPKVMCGGPWRNSVYDTSGTERSLILPLNEKFSDSL